jgi:uncharacterized protein
MDVLKIVITGAVGTGKTTFVKTISEIDVVKTERRATDDVADLKSQTTVALDFGRIYISPDRALHLYGTPGQPRFDFMWDILIQKAHAYIMLVHACRPQDFRAARSLIQYMNQRSQIPMIVGLTHTDCDGAWDADDIASALKLPSFEASIVEVNANQRSSVLEALILLVQKLMPMHAAEPNV